MAAQALYRQWRPQTYDEISAQEHVTRTLRNALREGRIAHAYLFAGPRGTGKTSMARILAKAVNCLSEEDDHPCNRCAICQAINEGRLLDLIEIDAASNRGIDEVRDLREKIGFVPNQARYKVYILDEAHMLTEPAFNALLKTLEEPPPHVIFVLVTTEAHKIPLTIRSRCQRFDFRRIPKAEIVARLERIVEEERLDVEPAALDEMARSATGSLRDAISLLDQLRSYGQETITLAQVQIVQGSMGSQAVQELIGHLASRDVPAGLAAINRLLARGVEIRQLLSEVLDCLRQLLLIKVGAGGVSLDLPSEMLATMTLHAADFSREELLQAVRLFNQAVLELKGGTQSQLPLELAFIEAAAPSAQPAAVNRGRNSATATAKTPETSPPPPQAAPSQLSPPSPAQASAPDMVTAPSAAMAELQRRWKEVLTTVRQHSFKTEAALRSSCQPLAVERGVLTIAFRHEFHKGLIEDPEHRPAVEQAVSAVLGQPHKVRCVLMSDQKALQARRPAQDRPIPVETGRAEKDATPTVEASAEEKQPLQEIQDPVVREAIANYGATIVSVTRR
ncbi:MAG: DNA polymerase III subunit gamma/tau [Chloroflexi bacterium]|nr:DNA polymerase III subunit gamma/tau [Chloroflexota bacterium]